MTTNKEVVMDGVQIRLTELRTRDKLSIPQFASRIGVSRQAASCWMNGDYEPGLDSLIRVADEFDVSLDWLVGRI